MHPSNPATFTNARPDLTRRRHCGRAHTNPQSASLLAGYACFNAQAAVDGSRLCVPDALSLAPLFQSAIERQARPSL